MARVDEKTPRALAEQKLNAVYTLPGRATGQDRQGRRRQLPEEFGPVAPKAAGRREGTQLGARGDADADVDPDVLHRPGAADRCRQRGEPALGTVGAAGQELAIRTALGASRWQIIRQLLVEAVLLSLVGGLVGGLFGAWTLDFLIGFMSQDSDTPNYLISSRLDATTLGVTFAISVLTGLLFGLYPAWSAARGSLASTMKEDSGNASATTGGVRARRGLVCAQVALSMILLIPMGLLLKSMVNLTRADIGLRTEDTIVFGISPELNGYSFDQCRNLFQRSEEALAAIPGVGSVTVSMVPLIGGSRWGSSLRVEGYPDGPNVDNHSMFNSVGARFFGKFGVRWFPAGNSQIVIPPRRLRWPW